MEFWFFAIIFAMGTITSLPNKNDEIVDKLFGLLFSSGFLITTIYMCFRGLMG